MTSLTNPISIRDLNALDQESFVRIVGPVFENSPWIARETWSRRPFSNVTHLHEALCETVRAASEGDWIELINAHPDLAGREAQARQLTAQSESEQAAAGMESLTSQQSAELMQGNRLYRDRFGFTFVICARLNQKEAILQQLQQRLRHNRSEEIETALTEIFKIAHLRLGDLVSDSSARRPTLTTHVLDVAQGRPAANMQLELWRIVNGQRQLLVGTRTNANGRTDAPLLEGELTPGQYELVFYVGDYFSTSFTAPAGIRFLDRVPIVFGIADGGASYHIPLLCSPWAYSTYRGS
jgi:2-oxo-4-hydroxy-4-carboxy-5-ureidoimidazoline decarboxylase